MRRDPLLIACLAACLTCGCTTPSAALLYADRQAGDEISHKQTCVYGHTVPYDVDVPRDRIRDETVNPATGLATRPSPLAINLKGALEIAARNSRDYQSRKEALYRVALQLVSDRVPFTANPFLNLSTSASRDGSLDSVGAGGELGITRMFDRGGRMVLSAGGDLLRFISNPTSETASTFLNLVVTLPLFRGAGEDVVLENLRQADRDVLYAVRDLERFKQTFSVQVETQYYGVLASARRVENQERHLVSLTEARLRNEAFAQAQRITEIEVDQARQDELKARNSVVVDKNSFQGLLDTFKNTLGVPVDLPVTVDQSELETLAKTIDRPFEVDEPLALTRGIQLRLDLQNVRDQICDARRRIVVAENQLEPDVTVALSARGSSDNLRPFKVRFENGRYIAGVDAALPLERRQESVSLREAHLDLSTAIRRLEDISEEVKIEIRDALRTFAAARESYKIQERAVAVAKRRVESVNEFILRGDATTRDLLEAQDALVNAENDLVTALVTFRVTFLNFYSDTGALVVSPEGLNHETSDALLASS